MVWVGVQNGLAKDLATFGGYALRILSIRLYKMENASKK